MCKWYYVTVPFKHVELISDCFFIYFSVIELPATDGSLEQRLWPTTRTVNSDFTYFGPEMPPSAIVGAREEKAERIVVFAHQCSHNHPISECFFVMSLKRFSIPQTELCTKASLTPAAICWTTTSELYVGCEEGFLLLVDPESRSVSVLFNPTGKHTQTLTYDGHWKVSIPSVIMYFYFSWWRPSWTEAEQLSSFGSSQKSPDCHREGTSQRDHSWALRCLIEFFTMTPS